MNNKNNGQTLLEVVVATAILALVLTVMVAMVTLSMATNRLAKEQAVATRLGQGVIETIRQQRDELGWRRFTDQFVTNITYFVKTDELWNTTSPGDDFTESKTVYTKEIAVTEVADQATFVITIKWYSVGRNQQVSFTTILADI